MQKNKKNKKTQKHKKSKTCKKSNNLKNCTFAPAISTSYSSSSKNLLSTPIKRKKGDNDDEVVEDCHTPSQKEARMSFEREVGTEIKRNDSNLDVTQTDNSNSLGGCLENGFNLEDNCELKGSNSQQDNSDASNENSSHFSSQYSPRHHRGKLS